ncbi:integrase [Scytonema hofmannii PCC 7110]|uniref:Integrase n=1 Tax=Scytonema hofmannii PCC 7110 TaxID=128403 RepID=A0A139WQ89_9CYAN|nr:tyrosine-type recombinase/integrase [Scytonema hofmannii]KYC34596.1 integrase [Scytonema hofmannii PCC 7110]
MSSIHPENISVLESSFALSIGSNFSLENDPDVVEQLIGDKRSLNTKREYQKDLRDFFLYIAKTELCRDLVLEFLHLEQKHAVALVFKYKAHLMKKKLAEATVNRRLSAIKSMVEMGRRLGVCNFSLDDVKGEKVETYRDTKGIPPGDYARVIGRCDRTTLKGKRDYAILRLLWDNALRRNEIVNLNVCDFNLKEKTLSILGKGKGTQKQVVSLSEKTVDAIASWLKASQKKRNDDPMFTVLAYHNYGERLTGEAIRRLVDGLCKQAGITKKMSPHRVRHSAITTVLDQNNGNYRATQRFSRHAQVQTVLKYDDNRQNLQKAMSDKISDLI